MKLFFHVRVWWKLLASRYWLCDSFCKNCGVDVRDFIVPDDVWTEVQPHINHGNVLCYNCFHDVCSQLRIESVWYVVQKKYCEYCAKKWDVDVMEYASPMNLACPYCFEAQRQEDEDRIWQAQESVSYLPRYED